MTYCWDAWDERVMATGRPNRAAEEFTNEELLTMLAHESDGRRNLEKQYVKQELFNRLEAPHRPKPQAEEGVTKP